MSVTYFTLPLGIEIWGHSAHVDTLAPTVALKSKLPSVSDTEVLYLQQQPSTGGLICQDAG